MKAAVVVEPGQLEIRDVPEPRIGDYQVLVEQLVCGVCTGTDSKLIAGHFKGFSTYPAVLGHEAVGRVIECGKHVRYFQPGDLVLRPGLEQIGDGSVHSGWGAFAQYGVAGDWRAMREDGRARPDAGYLDVYLSQQKVPASLAPAHAAMLITYKEVLSSAHRFGFRPNASILIYGLGPVGLTFVRFAKILGLGPILAADRHPNRRALACEFGADGCCDPTEESPEVWAKRRVPGGLDFVVDAVGVSDLVNRAMSLVKFNGSICVYGVAPETDMRLDWSLAPYNWTLQFLQWPTFSEESATHEQVLGWVQTRIVDPAQLITHVLPLDDLPEAFQLLRERKALKVVIDLTV
jgi:2-desacetyl-2-hydroxyethyl bacteriochlorophyllide A dehydrogenase